MTVLIIALLKGRTLEQWYEWMASKLENGVGYKTPSLEELPVPFKEAKANEASSQHGGGSTGGGSGGGLGSVLSGSSLLYNRPNASGNAGEEDSDEEDNLLSRLQSALEQQGIRIVETHEDDDQDEDAEMKDINSASDKSSGKVDGEVAHPAVDMEGLTDKVSVLLGRWLVCNRKLTFFDFFLSRRIPFGPALDSVANCINFVCVLNILHNSAPSTIVLLSL